MGPRATGAGTGQAPVVGTPGAEDNMVNVSFSILNIYLLIELSIYVKIYVVGASRRKGIYNSCYNKMLFRHMVRCRELGGR